MNSREFFMKSRRLLCGFTMIELMIVVGIVALLVALAVPSYARFARKAHRSEAQQLLMNWANNQEIWRSNNVTYADDLDPPLGFRAPNDDYYDFIIADVAANSYTITATAKVGSNQEKDDQQGISCTPITLNQSGAKTPDVCW